VIFLLKRLSNAQVIACGFFLLILVGISDWFTLKGGREDEDF
jgi:hypothetical protein